MTYGPYYSPSYPPPPPPPAKRKTGKVVALVGTVVVLLGVGGMAVAAVTHWGPFAKTGAVAPGGRPVGGGQATGLAVTGDAPTLEAPKPTFADGYRQAWASELTNGGVMAATDDVLVVYEFGDVAHPIGIDRASGEQWPIDGNWCLGPFAGKAFACREALGPEEYSDTYEWVDIATGKSTGALDASGLGPFNYSTAEYANGLLVVAGAQDVGTTSEAKVGYFTGPGKPKWIAEVSYRWGSEWSAVATDERDGLLAWTSPASWSYVFDEQTGTVVYDGNQRVQLFSGRIACISQDLESSEASRQVQVSGGTPANIVAACGGEDAWMVNIGGAQHPDVALLTSEFGTVARDPRQPEQVKWASEGQTDAWPVIWDAVWDGANTVFAVSFTGQIWSFDVDTGRVNWWSSYPTGLTGEGDDFPSLTLIDDSMLGLHVPGDTEWLYFRTPDGQMDATLTNLGLDWPEAVGGFLAGISTARDHTVVLEPAFSQARASRLAAPAGMPSCPSGMSVVSWTKYDTGSVLVCAGGSDYQVVLTDTARPGLVASGLDFTPAGIVITCTDKTVYRIGGGASIVIVDAGGASSVHPASQAWTPASGQASYRAVPSGIVACPAGSWPISLSTWNGGWLLVCGTDSATPTWLGFSDGTAQGTGTSVTATGSGYCADTDAGRVCANRAPALVTVTPAGGAARQYPVGDNFFPGAGAGGVGEGSGAYGVDAPKDTAADEARYLEQVLQASAKTRASLKTVLADLNNDLATDADIATLRSVVDSRAQLIEAVDGAPVSNLPNGPALVATLREALVVSKQTDELYVTWAQQIQAKDWDAAHATIQRWRGPASQSEELKKQFVAQWNANVASAYGLSTFKADQI